MITGPIVELVPLADALIHAKVLLDPNSPLYVELQADAQAKLTDAHGIIFDYLKNGVVVDGVVVVGYDPTWTATTAPRPVLAAIKERFAYLIANLGDDARNENYRHILSSEKQLLDRLRDPTLV
jgi:hypothetical protein